MVSVIDYKKAGVDIDKGNEAVKRIQRHVNKTYFPAVLSKIGGFAGLIDLPMVTAEYTYPILVQSIDGLGTKPIIARQMNRYDTLGADLLSATANDILVVGAKPITLLDYIANDSLDPDLIEHFIRGLTDACAAHDVALVGGETAEMPDVYLPGEHDFVGIVTGIVDRHAIVDGSRIQPGDHVIGLASSGLHTNGYSLARRVFSHHHYTIDTFIPEEERTLGEILLTPHLNYTNPILACLKTTADIKGMAHITGGGLLENIPRILPNHCAVKLERKMWKPLPVFNLIQSLGGIDQHEMDRTFNMGIGYIIIVAPHHVDMIVNTVSSFNDIQPHLIGEVIAGHREVIIT